MRFGSRGLGPATVSNVMGTDYIYYISLYILYITGLSALWAIFLVPILGTPQGLPVLGEQLAVDTEWVISQPSMI